MRRNLRSNATEVTGNPSGILPADLDRLDMACRHAADRFLDRDCERFAQHAGISAQQINRQRERVDGTIPALAKVARLVHAGRCIGRSLEEVADFLSPVLEAADCDLVPRSGETLEHGVTNAALSVLRETTEAVTRSIQAARDGSIDSNSLASLRTEVLQAVNALHRLDRAVRESAETTVRNLRTA